MALVGCTLSRWFGSLRGRLQYLRGQLQTLADGRQVVDDDKRMDGGTDDKSEWRRMVCGTDEGLPVLDWITVWRA